MNEERLGTEPLNAEQRLDRLESRAAILDLVARYCHGADGRDADAFRSVWAADAVWDVGTHRFAGLDEILDAVARQWSAFASMHHSTSNSVVQIHSDDEATGRHDVLSVTVMPDGRRLLTTGQYADRYSRAAGRWAIAERVASVTSTSELPTAESPAH